MTTVKRAPRLPLGTRVTIRASLVRDGDGAKVFWRRDEHEQPIAGIVVGYRTRHDGRMESERDEWGGRWSTWYEPTRGFGSVLVATDLVHAHRICLPADVEPEAEQSEGVRLIAVERTRQIQAEGWSAEHDDTHTAEELARAAAVYAWPTPRPLEVKRMWPWDRSWFKPAIPGGRIAFPEAYTDDERRAARMRDLVRAGALIAAEIDRLSRQSVASSPVTPSEGR